MDQSPQADPRNVQRVVLGSFAIGLVLFGGAVVYLVTSGGITPPLAGGGAGGAGGTGGAGGSTLNAVLIAAAVVLPIGAGVVGAFIKPREGDGGEAGGGRDAAYAVTVIRGSLVEGAGLAAGVIGLFTGELWALVGVVIAVGLIVRMAVRV